MDRDATLREQLAAILAWGDAPAGFEAASEGIPPSLRGVVPPGLPHSAWQILEHLRLAQRDILDFCVRPEYHERTFPDDYWPASAAPETNAAWEESVAAFRVDRDAMASLAQDRDVDLLARVPNGNGQTFLREILLVADHNAYHVGQLILVRRALGIWG